MREPKISFVNGLQAQINIDLCRCLNYDRQISITILAWSNGFIYGGAKQSEAWDFVTVQPYGFTATIDAHKVGKEHFGA